MSMRTNYEFRKALARNVQIANADVANWGVANCILGELDDVINRAWSHLSDMGLSATEFAKIKRLVKKRL